MLCQLPVTTPAVSSGLLHVKHPLGILQARSSLQAPDHFCMLQPCSPLATDPPASCHLQNAALLAAGPPGSWRGRSQAPLTTTWIWGARRMVGRSGIMSLMWTWRRDSPPSRCPATRMRIHMLWPRGTCARSCCERWEGGRAARVASASCSSQCPATSTSTHMLRGWEVSLFAYLLLAGLLVLCSVDKAPCGLGDRWVGVPSLAVCRLLATYMSIEMPPTTSKAVAVTGGCRGGAAAKSDSMAPCQNVLHQGRNSTCPG